MTTNIESFSRYLPTDQQAKKWGWRLVHAGRQNVPPHSEYPSKGHPHSYLFDKSGRRTLDEYQIVYITTGSGIFESRTQPKTEVRTGDAILLFPGEWHRYYPDAKTGWSEYWIGFRGREANRIMEAFFSPKDPILKRARPMPLFSISTRFSIGYNNLLPPRNKYWPAMCH